MATFSFLAALSSEELSSDDAFLFFLLLPAFIQGVSVTAVVTRPGSSGTKTSLAEALQVLTLFGTRNGVSVSLKEQDWW